MKAPTHDKALGLETNGGAIYHGIETRRCATERDQSVHTYVTIVLYKVLASEEKTSPAASE